MRQLVVLAALGQRVVQLELDVEMILDDSLVAAGHEDEMSMPASRASSTTYWMTGRSTTVSISFGIALVAGKNRVPRPATGKTALRTFFILTTFHRRVDDACASPFSAVIEKY